MAEPSDLGRREFVKWSAAGVIAGRVVMQPLGRRRDERIRGANDRVVVALIGAGRQGQSDLGNAVKQPDTEVARVCDVYEPNLAKGLAAAPGAKPEHDFRRVLDDRNIDAVIIATPDHWHPIQTILACEAGKDVYVEKPIGVTVTEGRAMVRAARRYDRVVQAARRPGGATVEARAAVGDRRLLGERGTRGPHPARTRLRDLLGQRDGRELLHGHARRIGHERSARSTLLDEVGAAGVPLERCHWAVGAGAQLVHRRRERSGRHGVPRAQLSRHRG